MFTTASKLTTMQADLAQLLTTSQFVTAPKPKQHKPYKLFRLTTSQFVTAPKRQPERVADGFGLTTSQFVTAPKQN